MRLVLVVGTATEVGKTWTTASLIELATARGLRAVARKPVQSFDPASVEPTDAEVLAAASGEPPEVVCPPQRWLSVPMAPPMAAEVLGLEPIMLEQLLTELCWPDEPIDLSFVESVGGVRSPVADDGDSIDLAAALKPDVVILVADAALGVIDRVRLASDALRAHRVVVFLNQFDSSDDLHERNRAWLVERDGLNVATSVADLLDRL